MMTRHDAPVVEYINNDSPEMIQKCLSCVQLECNNCFGARRARKSKYVPIEVGKFIRMYNAGMKVGTLARSFNLSDNAMRKRLDAMRLPFEPDNRPEVTVGYLRTLPPQVTTYLIFDLPDL